MAEMTNKERIMALLAGEKPDRVPIYPFAMGFPVVYTQTSIADAYNKPDVAYAAQKKCADDFDWIFLPQICYAAFGAWEFGGEIRWPSTEFDQAPIVVKNVTEDPEEALKLELPEDVGQTGIVPIQKEFMELCLRENSDNAPWKIVFQLEGTFNMANNIVGTTNMQRWTIKHKDAAHHVLRLVVEYQKRLLDYWKDCFGVEDVLPWGGEPSATNQLISPKTFEQFVFPYVKEVHEYALSLGYKSIFKHICAEQNKNLPFWSQMPMGEPGFVSFGHEVDLLTAAEYFPNDIVLGNIEPVILMIKSPEEVYEATKAVLEKGKQIKRGFVLAPGCDLPPPSPPENIMAMTKAVQDHGWY